MTTKEKLQLILRLSDLTQAELANRLQVTFAALNRWINEKAAPRPGALAKIDELYKEYSGEKQIPETLLAAKEALLRKKQNRHRRVLKKIWGNPDIRDQFYLSLTYHSNRIEGSTLSENETAAILFQNAVLPNKTLVEQLEAKNHQAALTYLFEHLLRKQPLNEALILKLHGILMNAIRADAGRYRNHGVRIMGTSVPTANYVKVPSLMKELVRDTTRSSGANTVSLLAAVHARFEKIHPFADGNGRVGRLLLHAMALHADLPPAVIMQENRRLYVSYLNKAQMKDDVSLLQDFICDAILEGYRIVERR